MQPSEHQSGYLRLNVWAAAATSALTALVMAILSLPLHFMHARAMFGDRGVSVGPGHEMAAQSMMGGGPGIGFILVGLLVVLVYAGVAGAIFAAIYNAILSRR